MLQDAYQWIITYPFTSFMGVLTYWLPLAIMAVTVIHDLIDEIRSDIIKATKYADNHSAQFNPKVTIGYIVWLCIITVTPFLNIGYAIFWGLGVVWSRISTILHTVFSFSIIRPPTKLGQLKNNN